MKRRTLMKGAASGLALSIPQVTFAQGAKAFAGSTENTQRLRVGSAIVTALSDGYVDIITPQAQILQGIDTETYEQTITASGRGAGARQTDVNAYLVEMDDRKILIDAGTNKDFIPTLGRTPEALVAAGHRQEDITDIVITHMHPDHSAGLISEDGDALHPNARVLVHELEYDYWVNGDPASRRRSDMEVQFRLAKAAAQVAADRLDLFSGEEIGLPGITAVPLFGHTPGHVGCIIESDGDHIFVVSDIVHQSVIQLVHPEVSVAFDVDQDEARKTRIETLDRIATDRERIIGMHMPFPGAGRIERASEGYRWIAEEREYF